MAGTAAGGKKGASIIKKKYGDDHYAKLALLAQESWRKNGRKPRGFAVMPKARLRALGAQGGAISRRGKKRAEP